MKETYACPKYRSLKIRHLQFKNGMLTVRNSEDKALVEGSSFYGAHIFRVEVPEEVKPHGKKEGSVGKDHKSQAA